MKLSDEELLTLWKHSRDFHNTALRAFGRNIPKRSKDESITVAEIDALRALRVALHDGRFIAIGFPEPRRHGDRALLIPREAWAPDTTGFELEIGPGVLGYWHYNGLAYCEVRIAATPDHLTRTRGRPTVKPLFEEAIRTMIDRGEVDPSRTQKSHFKRIRQVTEELFPMQKARIKQTSDRSIAGFFQPFFNDL